MLAMLKEHPAVLDHHAQAILLGEIVPVFTEADNRKLERKPEKEKIKEVIFKSKG